MEQVKRPLFRGRTEVVDADLSSYFDTIPRTPEKERELRKPYAGKPHVRFDEGALETEP